MQDGSTRVRRVVNSGKPLTVEEGRKREDWEATRECDLNVVCIFFLGQSFPEENDFCFFLSIVSTILKLYSLLINLSIKFC